MRVRCFGLATVLMLVGALAACGSDEESAGASGAAEASVAESSDGGTPEGRAFNSTDDAIVQALTAAIKAEKVEFDRDRVLVYREGSATSPTAGLYCSTIDAVIGTEERGFIVYPDGEIDCEAS